LTRERQALEVIAAFFREAAEELRTVAEESLATAKEHRRGGGDQYELGGWPGTTCSRPTYRWPTPRPLSSAENQVELSAPGWRCGWAIPATGP
jgi:hypothetical protein